MRRKKLEISLTSVSIFIGLLILSLSLGLSVAAITISLVKYFMENKTDRGSQELAGWIAFRKWLKDYSVTKNSPIDSVVLWEKYIVYGTALGISLKALSQLPINMTKVAATSGLVYAGYTSSSNLSSSFSGLSSGFTSLSSAFSSYGASGVGSSGGFSGGGGGGGGGSGGGAG